MQRRGECGSKLRLRPRELHRRGRSNVLRGIGIAGGGAVPDASTERRDVDHTGILRIRHYAVAPFEVVPFQAPPGLTAIVRTPHRRFTPASVEHTIAPAHRHVLTALITGQRFGPRSA